MSEIKQLDRRNIDFGHRIIDVDASIAKMRQQRFGNVIETHEHAGDFRVV